ncbi:MAG: HAMP domain-containing histidine kinase [Polyangiaceae bacterium]|nr:HAMP domain-containing histidine kinase [Polyangiaceae bacterium]
MRTIFGVVTIVVTALCLSVAGALIILSTMLRRATNEAVAAAETIRVTEEAEIDVLLHAREAHEPARLVIGSRLRTRLSEARLYGTSTHELAALDEARKRVEDYVTAAEAERRTSPAVLEKQEAAIEALERLGDVNVAQSQTAQMRAEQWNQVSRWMGLCAGVLAVAVAISLLVWLRARAFAPISSLAGAMQRFGQGDVGVRAEVEGAAELRAICYQFNQMADGLVAQRQAHVAFIGGVAHDVRNPLSALKMSLALLRPGQAAPSDEQLRRFAAIADRQLTQLERMIGDFLDIERIEVGKLELKTEKHDGVRIVREVADLFEGTSPKHRLKLSAPSEPIPVECDALRVQQVLINLVSNAIKYSPGGGDVDIRVNTSDGEMVVSVTDSGVGISETDQVSMFEPFRRVGLSKGTVPGVGLGLYVVKKLVEAHDGRIDVQSTPGTGSTFTVRLPVVRRDPGTSP